MPKEKAPNKASAKSQVKPQTKIRQNQTDQAASQGIMTSKAPPSRKKICYRWILEPIDSETMI